jgi:hypothetical protein
MAAPMQADGRPEVGFGVSAFLPMQNLFINET